MTDKVQKIKEWIQTRKLCTMDEHMKFYCKEAEYDYNLLCSIEKILDSLQEEPKKCMYTKDHYTDEDRKVLCDGCEGECKYPQKEKPVSEEFEKKFISFVNATHDNNGSYSLHDFAQRLYNIAKEELKEPVSDDLGEYINELSKQFPEVSFAKLSRIAVRVAKWQKEQFEKEYTDLCNGIATAKGVAVKMAYDKGMDDAREQMMAHLWKPADGDDLPEIDREVIALVGLEGFFEIPPDEPVKLSYKVVFAHRPPEYWDGKDIVTGKVTRSYPKTYDKGGWNIPNVKYWLDCQIPNMVED